MKVNFEAIITDVHGEPIKKGEKDITLGEVAIEALLVTTQGDANLSGDEKFKRFELALACKGEADMKVDDIAKIKKRIGEIWNTLIVGRSWALLEGGAAKDGVDG